MGKSKVHDAAKRIAKELATLEIPFVIAGGLAVAVHGHVRATEDIDLLLTPDGLAVFKANWLGRGWVERFKGSRGLRDAVADVRVDVLLTGDYPGDGKPGPVAFPHPSEVLELDGESGLPFLNLETLILLKIASGLTAPHRLQDFADALNLIRKNSLTAEFGEQLDPYVHEKYAELWAAAQHADDEY